MSRSITNWTKIIPSAVILSCLVVLNGCNQHSAPPATGLSATDTSGSSTPKAGPAPTTAPISVQDQTVEAGCGMCQFNAHAEEGCALAVRIDDQVYMVDGSRLSDHGNPHASDGMCYVCRKAKVTGKIENGRFVAASFELLPLDATVTGGASHAGSGPTSTGDSHPAHAE
ncbi:MAG: DUF6370 family protein [Pirellulales bacterium]